MTIDFLIFPFDRIVRCSAGLFKRKLTLRLFKLCTHSNIAWLFVSYMCNAQYRVRTAV